MKSLFTLAFTACMITAQAQPGTIDKSFGTDKTGMFTIFSQSFMRTLAKQPDDKLLLGGCGAIAGQYSLLRHNKDGSADTSFGEGGQVIISINDLVKDIIRESTDGWNGVAVAPDGKIVTTGTVTWDNPDYPDHFKYDNDVVVARFLADGTPDESFGNHGRVVTNLGFLETATAVAVQADGKIIVAGYQYYNIEGVGFGSLLLRYNNDGSLDENFGAGKGYVKNEKDEDDGAFALLLQPDGKIISGGMAGGYDDFFLLRYLPDGTADASFGNGGHVITSFPTFTGYTHINSLALDTKGRIVAAGVIGALERAAVARYLPDGAPDNSFSEDGKLILPFEGIASGTATNVLTQPDNKMIITSVVVIGRHGVWSLALTGLNENGSLDSSFGTDGGQTITNISIDQFSNNTIMQTDGKIIVAGNILDDNPNENSYILARFNGYPTQVPLFIRIKRWLNNHGISWKGLPAQDNIAYYSIEQSSSSKAGFTQIAKVRGVSNLNQYSFTNSNLLQGNNYYRIKAVSADGTIRYSEVANADNSAASASVYPNPVKDYVSVQGLSTNEKADITIANGSGTVVAQGTSSGSTQYRTPATSLQPGTYYLHITSGSKRETLKFVKE